MTGPLPVPSPSGARVAGDRYQWLVAWHACLTVLHDAATGASNPAVSVGVEADDVGNLDDVVIRRRRPRTATSRSNTPSTATPRSASDT
jgi:hypothetical protein